MSNIYVPPIGPIDSEIILIGEAPAANEVAKGEPFVGSAGYFLNLLLGLANLNRYDLRITNLSKEPAPKYKMADMPQERINYWQKELIEEINELENAKILVPLGDYAMKALTSRSGITNFRGSILEPIKEIKLNCYVLPTFHPSMMHYNYEIWPLIVADLTKAKNLLKRFDTFKFKLPEFKFETKPTLEQVLARLNWLEKRKDQIVTIDVETPLGQLSCIGLGWSRTEAMCIPFFMGNRESYWHPHEEEFLWKNLAETLPKLNLNNQNFLFDWEVMRNYGVYLKMPMWDPMLMHHCLYSSMKHSLNVINSIYTDIPFYKKDEREEGDAAKGSSLVHGQEELHWQYNCRDCCSALWSIEELIKELQEENMLTVYENLYTSLFEPLLEMNIKGVPVDMKALVKHRQDLTEKSRLLQDKINREAGHPVNPNSPKQIKELLENELGLGGYVNRGTGKTSMNEENLKKMAHKYRIDLPNDIVNIRKISKELSLFSDENIINNRVKCQYSLGRASTGRLASRKSFSGRGMNLQNVKRGSARRFFIAESGHILIQADQMQAEARLTAWYSKDPKMIEVAESGKIHFENAKNLFKKDVEKGCDDYNIAKSLIHAGNYDIGQNEFARTAKMDSKEAKLYLELYHATYPGIRKSYHKYVQEEIKKSRMLVNPFGRRLIVLGRIDRESFKLGYAFLPQSTSTDITKTALSRIFTEFKNEDYKDARPLMDLHDGLMLSVPKGLIKESISALVCAFEVKFKIWGIEHTIPVEVSIGENWYEMEKVNV